MAAASQFKREWIPRTKNKSGTQVVLFLDIMVVVILKYYKEYNVLNNFTDIFTLQKLWHICVRVLHVLKATFSNSHFGFNVLTNDIYRNLDENVKLKVI